MSAQPCFRLLDLPGEIRNQTYKYALDDLTENEMYQVSQMGDCFIPSLLQVSRQLRNEAMPIFFAQARFMVAYSDEVDEEDDEDIEHSYAVLNFLVRYGYAIRQTQFVLVWHSSGCVGLSNEMMTVEYDESACNGFSFGWTSLGTELATGCELTHLRAILFDPRTQSPVLEDGHLRVEDVRGLRSRKRRMPQTQRDTEVDYPQDSLELVLT